MSNNYYDATGTLNFGSKCKVTPVIQALFGAFKLDPADGEPHQAYIAEISQESSTTWADIGFKLSAAAKALGLDGAVEADEEDGREWIVALLAKYGHSDDILSRHDDEDLEDNVDILSLFEVAMLCNDGHDLQSLAISGGWHGSRPKLGEFGGDYRFASKHVAHYASTSGAESFTGKLDAAIEAGDMTAASGVLTKHIKHLFSAIQDPSLRMQLAQMTTSDPMMIMDWARDEEPQAELESEGESPAP